MKNIKKIFIALIAIGFFNPCCAQQNNTMQQKKIIKEDIQFAIGGQKCFRESLDIPLTCSEEKLLRLLDKKGIALRGVIGRNLGGVTRMDCSEIKTWKSIPEYLATRIYKLSKELIVVFKEVEDSELILVTFMGNNDKEIERLLEELELNVLENSEAENLELFEDESRITERIRLMLGTNILTFTPKYPYHHFFIDNSNENNSKTEATKRAFFLDHRKYDLALIFDFKSSSN
ncbi:hypothetical protein [Aquimarina sp. 2304DJ70-9]|uniref:hypothetical protein n=1 Tax=Aquimarina penaris TaxID=3231044 RepID=UPI003461AB83